MGKIQFLGVLPKSRFGVFLSQHSDISVAGVVAFTVAAKRYQYRQRDEFCNIYTEIY